MNAPASPQLPPRPAPPAAPARRPTRVALVVLALAAVIASGFARQAAMNHRRSTLDVAAGAGSGGRTSLSAMNSYALALLLGGLRGPLVMFLWPSSETQKSERNLEDFDTKIEWIRLLQAEFDTVHIFQIWNKAYNISVQMANVGNKYATILDALDYALKVDRERPDNVNILAAIGQIYFDKLGNSAEKKYYKQRLRAESLPHELRQKLSREDPGWRRLEHDAVLDAKGNILPALLAPGVLRLTDQQTGDTYDGSELQYLQKYAPYPQGLSPFGFGYNYYKRAQLLQEAGKQRHRQLSDLVIDSRPALSLKNWAEDEQQEARREEIAAVGAPIPLLPDETDDLDRPTQNMPLRQSVTPEQAEKFSAAIDGYDLAARLVDGSDKEYERHVLRYPTNLQLYRQHRDALIALKWMALADRDYLKAILADATDAAAAGRLRQASADAYARAIDGYNTVILRFYVSEAVTQQLFPPGLTRENVDQAPPAARQAIVAALIESMRQGANLEFGEDVSEYARYIVRAESRLDTLGQAGAAPSIQGFMAAPPATQPAR